MSHWQQGVAAGAAKWRVRAAELRQAGLESVAQECEAEADAKEAQLQLGEPHGFQAVVAERDHGVIARGELRNNRIQAENDAESLLQMVGPVDCVEWVEEVR